MNEEEDKITLKRICNVLGDTEKNIEKMQNSIKKYEDDILTIICVCIYENTIGQITYVDEKKNLKYSFVIHLDNDTYTVVLDMSLEYGVKPSFVSLYGNNNEVLRMIKDPSVDVIQYIRAKYDQQCLEDKMELKKYTINLHNEEKNDNVDD